MTIVVTGIFLSIMFNVCTPLVYAVEETELIKEDENNSRENRVEDEIEEAKQVLKKYKAQIIDIIKYKLPLTENFERNLIVIKYI